MTSSSSYPPSSHSTPRAREMLQQIVRDAHARDVSAGRLEAEVEGLQDWRQQVDRRLEQTATKSDLQELGARIEKRLDGPWNTFRAMAPWVLGIVVAGVTGAVSAIAAVVSQ